MCVCVLSRYESYERRSQSPLPWRRGNHIFWHHIMSFAAPVTRPIRALRACVLPLGVTFCATLVAIFIFASYVEPLQDLQKTWTPATCTFTGQPVLSRVGRFNRRRADRWRISQPVSVEMPKSSNSDTVQAIAHRWPSRLAMGDGSLAGLYSWWLSIGGTGEVLVPPADGWFGMPWWFFGNPGKFRFTSPPNLKAPCWFMEEPDYSEQSTPPLRVKLSDEAISPFGYWAGITIFTLPVLLMITGVVYLCYKQTCQDYRDEWQRLEDTDID